MRLNPLNTGCLSLPQKFKRVLYKAVSKKDWQPFRNKISIKCDHNITVLSVKYVFYSVSSC